MDSSACWERCGSGRARRASAVVWDGGLAAERMALLPEYKAQRAEMPAGLAPQLDGMADYLRAAGIYSLMEGRVRGGRLYRGADGSGGGGGPAGGHRQFGQGFYAVGFRRRQTARAARQDGKPVGCGASPAEDGRGAGANCGLVEPGWGRVGQHSRRAGDWR